MCKLKIGLKTCGWRDSNRLMSPHPSFFFCFIFLVSLRQLWVCVCVCVCVCEAAGLHRMTQVCVCRFPSGLFWDKSGVCVCVCVCVMTDSIKSDQSEELLPSSPLLFLTLFIYSSRPSFSSRLPVSFLSFPSFLPTFTFYLLLPSISPRRLLTSPLSPFLLLFYYLCQ